MLISRKTCFSSFNIKGEGRRFWVLRVKRVEEALHRAKRQRGCTFTNTGFAQQHGRLVRALQDDGLDYLLYAGGMK